MNDGILCGWCSGDCRVDGVRWICKKCKSMGYLTNPTQIELTDIYSRYADEAETARKAMGGTDDLIARSILSAVGWFRDLGPTLEVGAGQGLMTNVLIKEGVEVLVVEPHATTDFNRIGVEKVSCVSDIDPARKFRWILLVEVFEHLLNPTDFIRALGPYLSLDGQLLITTPNAAGRRACRDGFEWSEVQNLTHINLFTPRSLQTAAVNAGYGVVKRVRRPVSYKSNFLANFALGVFQVLGVDGGLRYLLSEWRASDEV